MVATTVAVLEAHDVVFPEVRAALDLDQFHGDPAGVGEAVFATYRDVGALVFPNQLFFAITFHQGCALHHHPVLGSVVVHL